MAAFMYCDAYRFNYKSNGDERKVTLAQLHLLIFLNKYGIKIANYLGIDYNIIIIIIDND